MHNNMPANMYLTIFLYCITLLYALLYFFNHKERRARGLSLALAQNITSKIFSNIFLRSEYFTYYNSLTICPSGL